jgi:hypothetical protein
MITHETEELNEIMESSVPMRNRSLPENFEFCTQKTLTKQNVTFFSAQSLIERFSKRLRTKESNII